MKFLIYFYLLTLISGKKAKKKVKTPKNTESVWRKDLGLWERKMKFLYVTYYMYSAWQKDKLKILTVKEFVSGIRIGGQ